MFLLDTGILFASAYQAHIHHMTVSAWLATADNYATCGMTQIGLVRLLLADAPMHGSPLTVHEAHEVLDSVVLDERHTFIPCPAVSSRFVGQTKGHRAAVDDYLVQAAAVSNCRLATRDRALSRRWPDHTLLIQ
jgi:predicted nucleic acid-binding protein